MPGLLKKEGLKGKMDSLVKNLYKFFQKIEKGYSQTHSMRTPSPSYQNQTKIPQKQKIKGSHQILREQKRKGRKKC